ncbi:hypothetical protein LOTGIDRAFT_118654 [Lottia gigantea]|uniref:Nascent polypeptide-associated complex subunit alpha-like UBA domain-containing protein n=1 Tax=Lottia gigantea TaxID=225164 RepID=V4BYG8_LOTGI|nr:hypothetical protein LOTGIDRAFT_118654 [Lottia gigantea]ESO94179.1 hypothetical protein LOTGIDRAFT_118654 [Lottia gigantea]
MDVDIDRNGETTKEPKSKKHDSGTADLEKVTDYVEEADISSQSIGDAMKAVSDQQKLEAAERQVKEKELTKVKINKDDVDLIVNEMEIPRTVAEKTLRKHKGNLVEALVALTD